MQLGIFAKTFAGTAPRVVMRAAAQAGFAAVQYNMACSGLEPMPASISPETAAAIAAAARSEGLSLAAVSGTYNMIHPNPAVRAEGLKRLEVIAASCRAINTRLVTLCTGSRDPQDQWRHHPENQSVSAWKDLLQSMILAVETAERHDIELGIEPELGNVVNSAAAAAQLIAELASPRLRIVIDAANLFEHENLAAQRRIVADAVNLLSQHIVMAHAKDRAIDGGFVAAGQGVLDYDHYLACLAEAGFRGPLVTHGLSAAEAPEVARFLGQKLAEAGLEPGNDRW